MRRPFSDSAVSYDLLLRNDPLRAVELLQILPLLEGPVGIVHRLRPWDVDRPWDVSASLRVFGRVLGRSQNLAGEFLHTPHVNERLPSLPVGLEDVVLVRPDLLVWILCLESRVRV